jgi:beta-phosphoglucomutase
MAGGPKGVLFDLDGVLWDSSAAHAEGYRDVLAPFPAVHVVYEAIAGMRTDEAMRMLLRDAGIAATDELVARLTREKRERSSELLRVRKPLMPGCEAAVRRLASTRKLALATSASRQTAATFFAISGLADQFSVVVSGEDVVHAKPAPDIVWSCLDKLGLTADEVVFVEDSANGVAAGRAAGVRVIAVTGTEDPAVLRAAGAADVVTGLDAVVRAIEAGAW